MGRPEQHIETQQHGDSPLSDSFGTVATDPLFDKRRRAQQASVAVSVTAAARRPIAGPVIEGFARVGHCRIGKNASAARADQA
jgi:hypothetical protein